MRPKPSVSGNPESVSLALTADRSIYQRLLLATSAQIDRPMNARDLIIRDIIDLIVERTPRLLE